MQCAPIIRNDEDLNPFGYKEENIKIHTTRDTLLFFPLLSFSYRLLYSQAIIYMEFVGAKSTSL